MKSRFKYMLICSVAVIILLVSSLSVSYAAHEFFKSRDENADGKISEEEFAEDMKKHAFDRLDNSDDKLIAKKEWLSLDGITDYEKHKELFRNIDKDKDKKITFYEFSDYADKHSNIDKAFMGLDKDGSNSLSPDEITYRPLFKMITIKFK